MILQIYAVFTVLSTTLTLARLPSSREGRVYLSLDGPSVCPGKVGRADPRTATLSLCCVSLTKRSHHSLCLGPGNNIATF